MTSNLYMLDSWPFYFILFCAGHVCSVSLIGRGSSQDQVLV